MSAPECKYSQIEKEGLAAVWGLETLPLLLTGHHFTLVTDNRAIQLIFSNPSSKPPARIERWALRLIPFDFTIIHRPGKGNIADYLSRHPLPIGNKLLECEIETENVGSIQHDTRRVICKQ